MAWRFCLCFFGSILFVLSGSEIFAAYNGSYRNGNAQSETSQNAAREKMRLIAQATHTEVKSILTEMLEAANKNERPSEELVQSGRDCLEKNKQNFLAYEEKQKADYMLLQSWTSYYQKNMPEALSWSLRACKQDEAIRDAWNSQALFSLLSGKRPLEPKIKKPEPEIQSRSRRTPMRQRRVVEVQPQEPDPYTEAGILDFDMLLLRPELTREKFEALNCKTTSGETVEYVPGENVLCAFFMQSGGAVSDSNRISPALDPHMADPSAAPIETEGPPSIEVQREYFLKIMDACQDDQSIKFMQVDTIRPRELAILDMANYDDSGIATVIAASPDSNGRRLAFGAENPFMMIVDKGGSVKYAGPADGFMPAFIMTEMTGKKISVQPAAQEGEFGFGMQDPNSIFAPVEPNLGTEPLTAVEPNLPAETNNAGADPNSAQTQDEKKPRAKKGKAKTKKEQTSLDTPADEIQQQIQAENLLREAQLSIESSVKIRGKSPEQGIVACRKVLADYPDTDYAQQARELLRKVPDRYKERFNITDEELGL